MSEIQAWRFLVSRNQFLDYRTVVAPDFMCKNNIANLLAKTAEGDPVDDDLAYYREIYGSKSGDLTIIYRVREAQAKDINDNGEGILKDPFGREIYFIEGIVLREIQASLSITLESLDFNHRKLVEDYRAFWEWVSPDPAIPSEMTTLKLAGKPLQYRRVNKYVIDYSSLFLKFKKEIQPDSAQLVQVHPICSFPLDGEVNLLKFLDGSRLVVHYEKAVSSLSLENKNNETDIQRGINYIKEGMNRYIRKIIISSDCKLLCTANVISPDRNILRLLNLGNLSETDLKGGNWSNWSESGRFNAIAFSHDSSVIAVFEKNNIFSLLQTSPSMSIKLVDTKSGFYINEKEFNVHTSDIKCIEASPLDDVFASGDAQGFVKIWNWKSLECLGTVSNDSNTVNAIAFSPQQKVLVIGYEDGIIKIINYKNDVKDQGSLGQHSRSVNTLAFSPDGKMVASGGNDCKVKLWNVKSKKQIMGFSGHSGHTDSVMSVSFSPNGKLLASGSKDKTVKIWKIP